MSNEPSVPAPVVASEREYVRKLCTEYSGETSALERYALTLAGVIWSWCLTNSHAVGVRILLFAPVLTTTLFGIRALALYRSRQEAYAYIEKLDQLAGIPLGFGWEQHHRGHGQRLRVVTAYAFWSALQLITLLVAVIAWQVLP